MAAAAAAALELLLQSITTSERHLALAVAVVEVVG